MLKIPNYQSTYTEWLELRNFPTPLHVKFTALELR